MQPDILTKTQAGLLPLIKQFSASFYLVGGTALALQLGHRRSIDFDLFTNRPFDNLHLRSLIKKHHTINRTLIETKTEFTLFVDNIKITFYHYHYPIKHLISFDKIITMPDPLTIAAMKAFALGHRAKWKDYVDLYFILQHHSLKKIVSKAHKYYTAGEFDEKLFRIQLAYHTDLSYIEPIDYLPGFSINDKIIKQKLLAVSL